MIIGIIGGSGVEDFLSSPKKKRVKTPYGAVSVETGKIGDAEIIFFPRHGKKHDVLPHKVNYRANIFAFKKLNVNCVLSTSAVGSLEKRFKPGNLLLLSDFLDFTKSRESSFAGAHVDMSEPYSRRLNSIMADAVKSIIGKNPPLVVYAATEGPRFETKAEIRMFIKLGAQVVGMTNFPEVVLAKELGIPYASLAVVTNYACGISPYPITDEEVKYMMTKKKGIILNVLRKAIGLLAGK